MAIAIRIGSYDCLEGVIRLGVAVVEVAWGGEGVREGFKLALNMKVAHHKMLASLSWSLALSIAGLLKWNRFGRVIRVKR